MNNWIFRNNNLDLIRLLAATQVCVLHSFEFMFAEKTGGLFFEFLRLFPGVPIFFFVSGFLISKSYEASPTTSLYAKNRILRIYPALILVVFLNIVMVWSTGYFDLTKPTLADVSLLFLAKSTILQFYNPEFMRGFGDGVLNGSLWTITVELQFYIITPILYFIFGTNKKISSKTLLVLILFFIGLNRLLVFLSPEFSDEIWFKLFKISFLPWIYMFLVGIYVQKNFKQISAFVSKINTYLAIVAYCLLAYLAGKFNISLGNAISPLLFFPLIILILRVAYYKPSASKNLLKGHDISYGVYIWHMPVVNQLLYYDLRSEYWHAILAIVLSFSFAVISWFVVERPFLQLKKYTIDK